jgi:hypothetical protein
MLTSSLSHFYKKWLPDHPNSGTDGTFSVENKSRPRGIGNRGQTGRFQSRIRVAREE